MPDANSAPTAFRMKVLSKELLAANGNLLKASKAVAIDKAQRKINGLWSRVVDFFTVTEPEKQENLAKAALDALESSALTEVPVWFSAQVDQLIVGSSEEQGIAEAFSIQGDLDERHDIVMNLFNLARNTQNAFWSAASSCSTAATYEYLDAASTDKTVAAISHSYTSSANRAVRHAVDMLNALRREAPQTAVEANIGQADDTFDFILDMTVDPAFDFLSFLAASQLHGMQARCNQAAQDLNGIIENIGFKLEECRQRRDDHQAIYDEMIEPFKQNVLQSLPDNLHVYV